MLRVFIYLFIYFILSKSKSLQNHWIENMSTKNIIIKYIWETYNISIKYKYTETIKVLADNFSDHGFPDFQFSKMFWSCQL